MIDESFRGSEAVRLGVVTKNHLRGPRFRRMFRTYVPVGLADDLASRSRAAFQLVGASGGVLAGYSAAELLGADRAPRGTPAEVLMERTYRRYPGLRVSYGEVVVGDIVEVDRCRVTSPLRTAWDLARWWRWPTRARRARWRPGCGWSGPDCPAPMCSTAW